MYQNYYDKLINVIQNYSSHNNNYENTKIFYNVYNFLYSFSEYCVDSHIIV